MLKHVHRKQQAFKNYVGKPDMKKVVSVDGMAVLSRWIQNFRLLRRGYVQDSENVTTFRRNLDFCFYGRTCLPQAGGSIHRNAGTVTMYPATHLHTQKTTILFLYWILHT